MDLTQLAADRRAMLALVDALAFCREIGELPHEGQIPILADRHRFQVVCCGARFGKSWSAGKWAAARMMVPGTRGWCVSGTYDLADKVYREVFGIFRRHGRALGIGIKRHVGNDKTQQTLELTNGSTLCTKSADHPDSLDAEGLDFAVFDEAAKCPGRILHQHLIPRLTDRRGSLLAISTARGRNWFFDQWTDAGSGKDAAWSAHSSPSSSNPHVFPFGALDPEWSRLRAQYERAHMLPLFQQEYEGDFACLQGRVWDAWDRKRHIAPLGTCRRGVYEWRLVADWGLRAPTCMLVVGRTEDDNYRVVDEVYKSGLTPDQRKSEAFVLMERWGIRAGWGDPADPTSNQLMCDVGLNFEAAYNDRDTGILDVAGHLGDDGGILVAEGACPNLEREIEGWVWRENMTGRDVEEPVKRDDHSCDALRYAVASWDRLDAPATVGTRFLVGGEARESREMMWRRRFESGQGIAGA